MLSSLRLIYTFNRATDALRTVAHRLLFFSLVNNAFAAR